jgi:MutS domain V
MLSPVKYYNQQKEHYNQLLALATKEINRIAMLRLCTAVGVIVAGIWAIHSGESWIWWLAVAIAALFLFLVRVYTRLTDKRDLLQLHLTAIENELQALQGNNSAFADGAAYIDVAHPYSYDLDIFGKGSIYQLVCRAVTVRGASVLAGRLLALILKKDVITGRQEIISELSRHPELLQNFRVAGMAAEEGPKDQANLTRWLEEHDLFINNMVVRIAAVLMPALSIGCIAWSVFIGTLYPGLTILVVVNWILLGIFQKNIKLAASQMGNCAQFLDKYESLVKQTAGTEYKNGWLQNTSANAKRSLENISGFRKIVHVFESRSNTMTGPLMNTFFLFDFYCLLRLETWRKQHKQSLLTAIDDVIDMDVYVSCAVYAFNHPENIYAGITSGSELCAKDLRHPLLHADSAVGNDFSLGAREQFYLLTGANMTGKSTFIRTIGVSNVLTNIGLPLPAQELSVPLLDLYTSMRITDSVQDDISYFRAELNRIRAMMDKVSASLHPFLVLLDEPLRGTNSTDKQQGTRAIVETLITYNAAGIIATHDTGLCDMEASHPGKISNYYFESKVEQGGLTFDFKLRPGGSTSNNATILMRQMGIIR